jgi:hypothetical protein
MSTTVHLYLLRFDVRPPLPAQPWNQVCCVYASDEDEAQLKVPETKKEIATSSEVNEQYILLSEIQAFPGGFQATPDFLWYPGTIELDENENLHSIFSDKTNKTEEVLFPLRLRKQKSKS